MDKKFSELQVGDEFYIWRYDTLYKYAVKRAYPMVKVLKDEGGAIIGVAEDDFGVTLDDDRCYTIIYPNESAMIWGTDGWNEYTILGTSKEAVKSLLHARLIADAKILEDKTEKWLKEFDN